MMSTTQLQQIKQTIAAPELQRNLRGQLRVALQFLTGAQKIQLAFDYAEHVLWIPNDDRYAEPLHKAKQFLRGQATIREVVSARSEMYDASYKTQVHAVRDVVSTINGALFVAARDELIKSRLVFDGGKIEPDTVAASASLAVARYAAGEDWDSPDKERKQQAREKGRLASDEETAWQITRLLEIVDADGEE
jgi:hypothetical protein